MITDADIEGFFQEEEDEDRLVELGVWTLENGGEVVLIRYENEDGEQRALTLFRIHDLGVPVEVPAEYRSTRVLGVQVIRGPE